MYTSIIIIDFDQTLVETNLRHYEVYKYLSNKYKAKELNELEYTDKRSSGYSNIDCMKSQGLSTNYENIVENEWNAIIEANCYLKLDKPLPWANDLLKVASKKHQLWLVSLRSNPDGLMQEVKYFGWHKYFNTIIPVKHSEDNVGGKVSAVQHYLDSNYVVSAWIGDGPIDKQATEILGIRFIDVESQNFLMELQELVGSD